MKQYKLKINIPGVPAGALLIWHEKQQRYLLAKEDGDFYPFTRLEVETNSDWFEVNQNNK